VTCHNCKKKGHITRERPNKNGVQVDGQIHANIQEEDLDEGENIFVQNKERGIVNKNYILLDNQSTVNQIANPKLLKNIRKASKPITVNCNAGSTTTDLEGELGSMTVKYNPYSIANVLSLHSIKQRHQVTYDSWDHGRDFQVHTPGGVVEFKSSPRGLHYLDVTDKDSGVEWMLVNMVQANFEGFTWHEVEKANEALRLQGMIGNPTKREFAGMVHENLITNCPVTVHDINNANSIFGPDLTNLIGKTTRTKPECVRVEIVQIPQDFVQLHKYVTLVADVMFVNGLPFLVNSSRGSSLVSIKYLPSRTAKHLVLTLQRVFRIYGTAGFVIQVAKMDMEFEKLGDMLLNVTLDTTAAREHVGEIKRKIKVIKERGRGTINMLPCETMPKITVIELMHFCVMWMNSFPVRSGVPKK
jgi:hypothetical protein